MLSVIRIYTNLSDYSPEYRPYLADILRPLINRRTREQNQAIYGSVADRYILVNSLEQADWAVLPMAWNYYYRFKKLSQAMGFIKQARKAAKPILTWVTGDYGARVPVSDVWVFGAAGYRRQAGPRRFATPIFIHDPLPALGMKDIQPRAKSPRPRIGFCGYARISIAKAVGVGLRTLVRNAASAFHLSSDEPQALIPPVWLRQYVLELLNQNPGIETHFIRRAQYKAGTRTPQEEQRVRQEFFENIRDTDYTVCIRGGGNFSVRLYETLAMGRIPIFIDTDCLLPYANDPHWQKYCVYVPWDEVKHIAEKVCSFHESLSKDEFIAIQRQARQFWEERLSFKGFFSHLPEYISSIIETAPQ